MFWMYPCARDYSMQCPYLFSLDIDSFAKSGISRLTTHNILYTNEYTVKKKKTTKAHLEADLEGYKGNATRFNATAL